MRNTTTPGGYPERYTSDHRTSGDGVKISTRSSPDKDPTGWSPSALLLVLGGVLVLAIGAAVWQSLHSERTLSLRIAGGAPEGSYYAFGKAFAELLSETRAANQVDVQSTKGSVENMQLVSTGAADLGFVQADTLPSRDVYLVAPLYEEVLHVFVARGNKALDGLSDLEGLRVNLGPQDSGTRSLALIVLEHFDIGVQEQNLSPAQALAGIEAGDLDAAFVLAPVSSTLLLKFGKSPALRLLDLGRQANGMSVAAAIGTAYPVYERVPVPQGTYGQIPRTSIETLQVAALLVAARSVPARSVSEVVETLLQDRIGLIESIQDEQPSEVESGSLISSVRQIRERYSPESWLLPFHPGAVDYYLRREPPFLVAYAEAVSLGLTLSLGLYSAALAARRWYERKKKNRIDVYYEDVRAVTGNLYRAGPEELRSMREGLLALRRSAIDDLMREKVDANEAFTILQDYLMGELAVISQRLAAMGLAEPEVGASRDHIESPQGYKIMTDLPHRRTNTFGEQENKP